jgi:hypothetical protein
VRVLVACEFSGIVRDAFATRGHDAWSCDLLPTERPGNHIQGDALKAIRGGVLGLAHRTPALHLYQLRRNGSLEPSRQMQVEVGCSGFLSRVMGSTYRENLPRKSKGVRESDDSQILARNSTVLLGRFGYQNHLALAQEFGAVRALRARHAVLIRHTYGATGTVEHRQHATAEETVLHRLSGARSIYKGKDLSRYRGGNGRSMGIGCISSPVQNGLDNKKV